MNGAKQIGSVDNFNFSTCLDVLLKSYVDFQIYGLSYRSNPISKQKSTFLLFLWVNKNTVLSFDSDIVMC